jgi:hypothetical protein
MVCAPHPQRPPTEALFAEWSVFFFARAQVTSRRRSKRATI